MRVITFKADEDLVERLDNICKMKGITRSEAIRKAIELWIKIEMKKHRPEPKIVRLDS